MENITSTNQKIYYSGEDDVLLGEDVQQHELVKQDTQQLFETLFFTAEIYYVIVLVIFVLKIISDILLLVGDRKVFRPMLIKYIINVSTLSNYWGLLISLILFFGAVRYPQFFETVFENLFTFACHFIFTLICYLRVVKEKKKKFRRFQLLVSTMSKINNEENRSTGSIPNTKIKPRYQIEFGKNLTKVAFSTADKATRRVIAPFVKVIKKGQKFKTVEEDKNFTFYLGRKPSVLMQRMYDYLSDSVELTSLLHESIDVLKNVTNATGAILYMVDANSGEMVQTCRHQSGERERAKWNIYNSKTVAAYVALNKEYVMVDDVWEDLRFTEGAGWKGPTIKSVLCVPVVTTENVCLAVIELYKDASMSPFVKNDLKIVVVTVGWMGAAIHQNALRLSLKKQQKLNEYLLNLTKYFFNDTALENELLSEMAKVAKNTLEAERCTFYILNKDNGDIIADVYEDGIQITQKNSKHLIYKKKQTVSLAKDISIAGIVAKTGKTLNILDAYNDPKYPKEYQSDSANIDRSVLCMPIIGVTEALGVMQLSNKIGAAKFTECDEVLLNTFATYASLVLYYSQLHRKMFTKEKTNAILSDMMRYHLRPCDLHIQNFKLKTITTKTLPPQFLSFDYYMSPEFEDIMPQLVLYMMQESVGYPYINVENMIEVILTIQKSYLKTNAYHNFTHAFNACHCMFLILCDHSDMFTLIEREALIIAALSHDVDHQGWTNNFLRIINSPISELYEDSPLEYHHYDVTIKIIGTAKCFTNIDSNEYHQLCYEIKQAILATDLANYFRYRNKFLSIVTEYEFDWQNSQHKNMLKQLMMTACDLCGQCKPYPIAKKVTDDLYKEFYQQGDVEKELGIIPLSMMDRDKSFLIPEDQSKFLSVVVIPCVELLAAILPTTSSLVEKCHEMLESWQDVIETRDKQVWLPEESHNS